MTILDGVIDSSPELLGIIDSGIIIPVPMPEYEGPYEVDPIFNEIILPTENKSMSRNLTVNAIEVQRVTNPFGGKTIYIGGIINE